MLPGTAMHISMLLTTQCRCGRQPPYPGCTPGTKHCVNGQMVLPLLHRLSSWKVLMFGGNIQNHDKQAFPGHVEHMKMPQIRGPGNVFRSGLFIHLFGDYSLHCLSALSGVIAACLKKFQPELRAQIPIGSIDTPCISIGVRPRLNCRYGNWLQAAWIPQGG